MKLYSPEYWMKHALEEAALADHKNEVPVGAIIVLNNEIIAKGHNVREHLFDVTAHAEIIAIRKANEKLQSWRLNECDLYVTLEPCPMCAGAILQARIRAIYYGASDPKTGCCGSLMNLLQDIRFNHQSSVNPGIMANECSLILKQFFKRLRQNE
jgi:tRNA(adenine34) deaminase